MKRCCRRKKLFQEKILVALKERLPGEAFSFKINSDFFFSLLT